MNYLSEKAKSIKPYVPGEQPQEKKYIKLNTNENPYPPSQKVKERLANYEYDSLRLYPDAECRKLKSAIAERENVSPEQVFCSNGSDEVLALAYQSFFNPDSKILFPEISYSFYPVYADLYNIPYNAVPLTNDFCICAEDYCIPNGGIIFANPNAPTGVYLKLEEVEKIIRYNLDKAVVIVDEAYIEFGGQSAVSLINKYPNLLIIKTFSKSHSLAGLRVGCAIGDAELINGLESIKNSFNNYTVDFLAYSGAIAALEDEPYYNKIRQKVIQTRENVYNELTGLGFMIPVSKTNFLFISHPQVDAADLFNYLKENGILVRYFNKPKIDKYLRVTIGTDEEMKIVVGKIREYLENKKL